MEISALMEAKEKPRPPFDPKAFLAKADGGRTITNLHERQRVFAQADPADSIFIYPKRKDHADGRIHTGQRSSRRHFGRGGLLWRRR